MPAFTRWGTWLEAAQYHAVHFDKIVDIVDSFDSEDAASINKAQTPAKSSHLKSDLAKIQANFSQIPVTLEKLQKPGVTIAWAIEQFDRIRTNLQSMRDKKYLKKIDTVANNNTGLNVMRKIVAVIDSDDVDEEVSNEFIESLSPSELAAFKWAPATSSDVERSFSSYKNILSEKRLSLTFDNLKKHVIGFCNRFD